MPKPDIEPYVEGDRLRDSHGEIVAIVRKCRFRSGTEKLRAFFIAGQRKDDFDWPDRVGKPVIDWTADGLQRRCVDCSRLFRTGSDSSSLDHIKCRTCEGFEQTTVRQMERTADMNDTKHAIRWRQQHKRTATDDVEDLIAEETRTR